MNTVSQCCSSSLGSNTSKSYSFCFEPDLENLKLRLTECWLGRENSIVIHSNEPEHIHMVICTYIIINKIIITKDGSKWAINKFKVNKSYLEAIIY